MKKKIIIFIIFFIFIIGNVSAATYYMGDVNDDNKVSVADYNLIRKHIVGTSKLTGDKLNRADVNSDNKITVADYNAIRKIIVFKEPLKTIVTETITPSPTPTPVPVRKVLPDTYVVPQDFTVDIGKTYVSESLKYKTIKSNNYERYYSIIWVKNAYKQLNSANNNLKGDKRVSLLSKEVKNMNYINKGLIATNGSFTWDMRANIPVIATKGVLTDNNLYRIGLPYFTLTIGTDNILVSRKVTDVTETRNWLNSVGARNTWAISYMETSNWSSGTDGGENHRTAICQVDENNFVLYTGVSAGIHDYMKELHDMFGCKTISNLDGGGSTGMYYKTKSMSDVSTVYQYTAPNECCRASCNNKCRSISDMLYFVEE